MQGSKMLTLEKIELSWKCAGHDERPSTSLPRFNDENVSPFRELRSFALVKRWKRGWRVSGKTLRKRGRNGYGKCG